MPQFHFNEGAIEINFPGVIDRSTNAYEIPIGDRRMSVVVSRAPRPPETDLAELAEKTIDEMQVAFRRFRAVPPVLTEWTAHKVAELEFTWLHDTGPMFNRVALIVVGEQLVSVTVAAAEPLRAQVQKAFETVRSTMKFRRPQ